jgi:YidC/Oxa1 family membrane protein insertase
MTYLWQLIFYNPILNVLVFFYNTIAFRSFGLAIIEVTLLLRLILFPFFHKGAKQQMLMQRIQPKVKKIQEQHKDDREKQAAALMELYKEHGVNPFSGFLLLIIQLPIILGLYWVVRSGLAPSTFASLYSFVAAPQNVNTVFLGIVNLTAASIPLVLCAAIAQFFQARLAIYRSPDDTSPLSPAEKIGRQMAYVGPIITILVFYGLPAAVGLYWLVSSLFSIIQQIFVNRHLKKKYGA